ncbi:MAG: diguanylate cyclase response regulator [Pseudoduganella sp.]|nr:diguanylate cyclase response regulator [Pseudoduganella sp.]
MRRLLSQIVEMTGRRPKMLVVDDDPGTVSLIKALFSAGIEIESAASQAQALEKCQSLHPDLILLDINLGQDNGFDLCREIKQLEQFAYVPVIFITASQSEEDEIHAFELGAVDFLRKPISPYIAESRVFTHLGLRLQTELLEQMAHVDGLTGLQNRRQFDLVLQREWKECARNGQPLSIIMADIDLFKRYNDTYGHLEGDRCLRQVATQIGHSLQRPGDCAARYGGEEFACILPRTGFEGALNVAMGLRNGIAALAIPHKHGVNLDHTVTASFGVATCYPLPGQDPAGLLGAADHQMYRSKGFGRNRVCGSFGLLEPGAEASTLPPLNGRC